MARANTSQTNFTSGEISPLMYGRVDVTKYFNGARKLTNMVVLPQGGIFRRAGTAYLGHTKSDGKAIFRKFIPNSFTSYALEFTDSALRFWKSGSQIVDGSSIPIEVITPYNVALLDFITIAQSADVAYVTCPGYPVYKLSYFNSTTWTFAPVSFNDGPYLNADTTVTNRIKVVVTSDATTLTSNAQGSTHALASTAIFAGGDVGKYVEYVKYRSKSGSLTWGLALVTANNSTTDDTVTVQTNIISPENGITFSGGAIHSTNPIFNSSSVGKFIRLTASQAWYQITSVSSSTIAPATVLTLVTYTYPTTIVNLSVAFAVGDISKYVDYKVNGQWGLSQITAFTSGNNVTVDVIDQILVPDPTATINVVAGALNTTSSQSGTFPTTSIGKYVKDTNSQTWGKITAVNGVGDKCTVTTLTMFAYTYPTVIMTLLNDRVITVQVDAREDTFNPINDVGNSYRFKFGAKWRSVQATAIVSAKSMIGIISNYLPWDDSDATNPYNGGFADLYRLPAWTVANDYPSVCSFHAGRLWFGGTTSQPTNLWSTETDDFESMSPTDQETGNVLDTNAITLTIASAEPTQVRWIKSGPVLLIGTESNEYQVKPNSLLQAISPTNIIVVPQTACGCTLTQNNALRIGSSVVFAQAGGGKLREMSYDFNIDGYVSKDISILSEHLFRTKLVPVFGSYTKQGIVSMDVGTNPLCISWMVMTDGTIVAMTYDREQDVIAFHEHQIGDSAGSYAGVESVTVIPDIRNGTDVVIMSVLRVITGITFRFVEQFRVIDCIKPLPLFTPQFVDSFSLNVITGAIVNSVGWDRFLGDVVQVIVDGVYIGTKTVANVSGGVGFALNMTVASYVVVGYQQSVGAYVELVDPEGGSQAGSSQGKKKRVVQTTLRVNNCPHPKIGASAGATNQEETVSSADSPTVFTKIVAAPAVGAPTYYTGDITPTTDDGFNSGGRLAFLQDEPYPFNLVAVFHKLDTNE